MLSAALDFSRHAGGTFGLYAALDEPLENASRKIGVGGKAHRRFALLFLVLTHPTRAARVTDPRINAGTKD